MSNINAFIKDSKNGDWIDKMLLTMVVINFTLILSACVGLLVQFTKDLI